MNAPTTTPALSGYLRADGRKGIRNIVVVAYMVECAHHVARLMVNAFPGQPVHLIGFTGCFPSISGFDGLANEVGSQFAIFH